jgi:4-hydroxy-tetrahydrodipicolinate synthase
MDVIIDEADSTVPVFVGAGAESVSASIELARYAESAGASAIVLPAPPGPSSGNDATVDYFARIATAVTLPVAIQDAPAYLGVALGPATVEAAVSRAPNIRIVKVEAGPSELSSWIAQLGDGIEVWGGDGGVYLLDALRVGATGIIPGLDLVDLLVQIYEQERTGETDAADKLFAQVLPMLVFEMQHSIDHYNACAKQVLQWRGLLDGVSLRAPAMALPEASKGLLRRHLDRLNLVGTAA